MSEHAILDTILLIVWALMLVVTVKYVLVIMRAENRSEGGSLALTALVLRSTSSRERRYFWIMAAGMVGAALFYGDGVIRSGARDNRSGGYSDPQCGTHFDERR